MTTSTVDLKHARLTLPRQTPQQLLAAQQQLAQVSMTSYFVTMNTVQPVQEAHEESHQDSVEPIERKNPQANRRPKPTR
jgi:hypothetical protein